MDEDIVGVGGVEGWRGGGVGLGWVVLEWLGLCCVGVAWFEGNGWMDGLMDGLMDEDFIERITGSEVG